MGNGIDNGSGLDEGPSARTSNGPGLAKGLANKLDNGSVDSAWLDEGPGVETDDGPGLAKRLADKLG